MRRTLPVAASLALVAGLLVLPPHLTSRPALGPDFVHFESPHVHPAAMTPDGSRLLVVNTPDNRLSVFDLTQNPPARVAEIPVGLEPIAVAARDDAEAWVVNHLSDDVSVVDLGTMHVKATIRVGDEPGDIVFAGGLAFVSVSQEDAVKAYDPATRAEVQPRIPIDGRFPMALARNAGGTRVYAAVLQGGNRTSVLSASQLPGQNEVQDSLPPANPPRDPGLPTPAPDVGLIIQQQNGDWVDESGKLWNSKVKYSMHEVDVAEITTASRLVGAEHGGMGTVNFNLAVSPAGVIALAGTEARNLVRFEPNLRGHMVDTRLSLVDGISRTIVNLNPHVNYADTVGTPAERDSAIGIPTGVAWSGDGQRIYVSSLASDKLAVLDASGSLLARVPTVAGPTGVVVDDARGRVYVVGRFRNQLQTLSAGDFSQVALNAIGFDPTPDAVVNGRKFFYGGRTSAHGDQACATCHVFGDRDGIGWDLGNPLGPYLPPPPGMLDPALEGFDPMKGPMDTQSLRGLPGTGVLHWRGDRADLSAFQPAFRVLLGRVPTLPDSEMAAFSEFVLPLVYPPNPRQNLGRGMPDAPLGQPSALRGQTLFMTGNLDGFNCVTCHVLVPGTNGQLVNDAVLGEDQDIKIPHLRNLYKKTGFTDLPGAVNKRGFGFIHDGTVDNLFNFLKFPAFQFALGPAGDNQRRDVEAFLLAFDTGMAPAVGHQITFFGTNNGDTTALKTLRERAAAGDCELVARGRRAGGPPRGWLYSSTTQRWQPDRTGEPELLTVALLALAGAGTEVTVTGVPVNSGTRMGLDRDRDTYMDGDELAAGTDPGDPGSHPGLIAVGAGRSRPGFHAVGPNPFRERAEAVFTLGRPGRVDLVVHDVLGREVRTLARGLWLEAGPQRLAWDGRRGDGTAAAAGIYFVRLKTGEGAWTRAIVRIP